MRLFANLAVGCWITSLALGLHAQEQSAERAEQPQTEEVAIQPDLMAELQRTASEDRQAAWGYWGNRPSSYHGWTNHTNRLVPIYVYGGDVEVYMNERSCYRNPSELSRIYGRLPSNTLNAQANYADQTDVYRLQRWAVENGGKKYIFLVVFDGMDWQTTQAAAIFRSGAVPYTEGRGSGLRFQDYAKMESSFGYCVVSPYDAETKGEVNTQTVEAGPSKKMGGYDRELGGAFPWSEPTDPNYLIGRSEVSPHAVPDSASTATAMTTGVKTFNGSINIAPDGTQLETIAHWLQTTRGFRVGVVTSVPFPHATPAAAYAHNVGREDYQDIARDMLGFASIAHRNQPLPGMDVVIGCGWGEETSKPTGQGDNFVPGNRYLPAEVRQEMAIASGGRYVVVERTSGQSGSMLLERAAEVAAMNQQRLFGFFGTRGGHLPFSTSNGDYRPVNDTRDAESYSSADIDENPTLAEMTRAALHVLGSSNSGFWIMVEAGDVDWANHSNNLDNAIGAVLDGDAACQSIFDWIDKNQVWQESLVIITADHGHYLNLAQPEVIAVAGRAAYPLDQSR